jgi:hypothetical protein
MARRTHQSGASDSPAPPRSADERTRDALVAAGVIAAAAMLWALALGVLDQGPAPATRFSSSPAARVERKPVLFAVRMRAQDNAADAVATAVPVASVDAGGVLGPAVPTASTDDARRAISTAFAEDYFANGAPLRLLYGGAVAGALRFGGAGDASGMVPTARVSTDATSRADVLTSATDDLLAISDLRYGAPTSGARPMRESHRASVEQLARAAVRDRYPGWQVESLDLVRVRVADLDRKGAPELLASLTARLRGDARRVTVVSMFLIGEPAGGETFRLAYVTTLEEPEAGEGFVFVDQVDLTASPFDEVVVRTETRGGARYVVLERGSDGWTEAVATPLVSAG